MAPSPVKAETAQLMLLLALNCQGDYCCTETALLTAQV